MEVGINRGVEGKTSRAFVGDMSEEKALQLASKVVSEGFLYTVCPALPWTEPPRSTPTRVEAPPLCWRPFSLAAGCLGGLNRAAGALPSTHTPTHTRMPLQIAVGLLVLEMDRKRREDRVKRSKELADRAAARVLHDGHTRAEQASASYSRGLPARGAARSEGPLGSGRRQGRGCLWPDANLPHPPAHPPAP